jgi:hypothetical protein
MAYATKVFMYFSEDLLHELREFSCVKTLEILGVYWKKDPAFEPKASLDSVRVFVKGLGYEGELILTGPKFYSKALGKGGYGGIDLAMLVHGMSFVQAVNALRYGPWW